MFFHITADERMHDILLDKNRTNKQNVMNAWDWVFLHFGPYLDIEDENSLDSYMGITCLTSSSVRISKVPYSAFRPSIIATNCLLKEFT